MSATVSRRAPLRRGPNTWRALGGSAILAAAAFVVCGWALALVPVLGLLLAVFSMRRDRVRSADGYVPDADTTKTPTAPRSPTFVRLALILIHVGLGMAIFQAGRNYAKGQLEQKDLRFVGVALKYQQSKLGYFPETLADLVLTGWCVPHQLESRYEPNVYSWTAPSIDPIHVSFSYRPGIGPWREDKALILAHDRAPYSRIAPRLIQPAGRFVLFADGRVEWLSEERFAESLRVDEELRRQIGWPTAFPEPPLRRIPDDLQSRPEEK